MNKDLKKILDKYDDIIKEEVNVKEIKEMDGKIKITKIFKPIWSKLSEKFGKDTGKIIQNGKDGNMKELKDGQIEIFDNEKNKWILDKEDYEIAYEWLQWENMAVNWDIIAKMDLEITPQLAKEWVAREISRFLNQMRKEADFQVDDKVVMLYKTENKYLKEVIIEFSDFLKHEALLKLIEEKSKPEWNLVSTFDYEWTEIEFALKK